MKFFSSGLLFATIAFWSVSCAPANVAPQKAPETVVAKTAASAATPETPPPPPAEDPDAVYQMRQMHLIEWIDKIKRDCERTKNTDAWLPEREGFLPEEIELVKKRCFEAVEVGMRGNAWINAMRSCAERYVQAHGKGKHECRLSPKDVPDLPPEMFDGHKAACTASCARAGEHDIELDKERSQFVRCCDGTTSPSCTYKTLHKGCCSGHHGVCIPD